MKNKTISLVLALMMLCSVSVFGENRGNWEKVANGVWKVSVGKPEKINLLSELSIVPKIETINKIGEVSLPFSKDEISFAEIDGKVYIRFPLEKEEQIYGLGLNFKTIEQRGRIMQLHMDNYGGRDNGRSHAPVPFFVSTRGYGAFINSARYIDVWAGTGVRKDSKNPPVARDRNRDPKWSATPYSDNLEFLVPAEGVEIIVFGGPTMLDVVRRFNLYNGGGALPPKWGLGFWQRVSRHASDEDVYKEIAEFEKHKFPLSVIGLEPGWMSKSYPCTYEWDNRNFPDPAAFVKKLNDDTIKVNVWMNGYVSPDGSLYKKIEPYTGSHTVWCGIVPDYITPEAKNIMSAHLKKHLLDIGVSGLKMDENDGNDIWLWPDVATFPSGTPAEQMRQIYGSMMQNMATQLYHEKNERTYGLVRAANAGTSSFPYVLYNDYYDHRDFITALINSSFVGVQWTPEVRSGSSAEDWIRRMQTVCFSPLAMINGYATGTKPWSFKDVVDDVNYISNLRMRLIPYFYTAFANYAFEGIPFIRAMNLEKGYRTQAEVEQGQFDDTKNPYAMSVKKESKDQFMVGEYLLVAPLFAGQKERKVILPHGRWYDFYSGKYVGGGEIITVAPGLSKIPVYVKDGGIIPMTPAVTKISDQKLPLELRYYGTKPSVYYLYDDDGKTYNYEKGEYTRIKVTVDVNRKGKKKGHVSVPKGAKVWSYSDYKFRYMSE